MTRTQECRNQLSWIEKNCPLDRTSIIPIKKASEFCEKYVGISTLSTDALQPLVKVKDAQVQERVVASLKTMIDSGKKPTKTIVKQVVAEATRAPHREEMIKQANATTPEQWEESIKSPPRDVILRLQITEHQQYIEKLKGWVVKCENDITEYQMQIKNTEMEILKLQNELVVQL